MSFCDQHLRKPEHERGFVLLWTLALLVLAAVVLNSVTRRSTRKAAEAVDAQDQLQIKWALASARRIILPQAEALLAAAERQQHIPVASVQLAERLGDIEMEMRVADEQAKPNLNAAYRQVGLRRTTTLALRLVPGDISVRLNPDPRAAHPNQPTRLAVDSGAMESGRDPSTQPAESSATHPFACWSQVFESDNPELLLGTSADPSPVVRNLTLWGDGRLNLRRASPEAARKMLELYLPATSASRILQARTQRPKDSVKQWVSAINLPAEQASTITSEVTGRSTCHSLLIRARNSQRSWYEMAILEEPGAAADDDEASTTQPARADTPAPKPATRPQGQDDAAASTGRIYRLVW